MAKIKFYGAAFWGECNPVKEYLLEKGIEFDYYDITESEEIKAEFYQLRTKYEQYAEIIEGGVRFGIPALFYDDKVIIGFDKVAIDEMVTRLQGSDNE